MKIYIDCKECEYGPDRTINGFSLNGKYYVLDYCCPGGTVVNGEARGCLKFVCRIGKKQFYVCCEEHVVYSKVERQYFIYKEDIEL